MTSKGNFAYLLDAHVLIALATPEHSLNAQAAAWFRMGHRFATCPITQGALLRFHLRSGLEATADSAKQLLQSICALPRHEFWPDTVSYLVLLAAKHNSALVTMDQALASVHPQAILISA